MAVAVNEAVKIVNQHSHLVLTVAGEATTEGTPIEQATDAGKDHQLWRLKPVNGDNGVYNIENVRSGMGLEVVGYSKDGGADIVQRRYDPSAHRQWKLVPIAGAEDEYKIANVNSGLFLDDADGRTEGPAPVKQFGPYDEDARQRWKLVRATAKPGATTSTPTTSTTATGSKATRTSTTTQGRLYSWGFNIWRC